MAEPLPMRRTGASGAGTFARDRLHETQARREASWAEGTPQCAGGGAPAFLQICLDCSSASATIHCYHFDGCVQCPPSLKATSMIAANRAGMDGERVDKLTPKQRECLRLVLGGDEIKEIAHKLAMTPDAVTERLRAARRTLGVNSSRDAARLFAVYEQLEAAETYMRPVDRPPDLAAASELPAFGVPSTGEVVGVADRNRVCEPSAAFAPRTDEPAKRGFPWPFRTAERPYNDLTLMERLLSIGGIAAASLGGLSFVVTAAILLMRFLVQLSKQGG